MAAKCPNCQFDNTTDSKFCKECGTQLTPSEGPRVSKTLTLETPSEGLTRGTVFAGRYEILEELGTGGMGSVYRVFDRKLEEEVALKLIRPDIAASRQTIERFKNELKLARKITHPNVCRMHDLHEEEKTLYITMEYVRGEDLKSVMHRMGTLTIAKAVSIAMQVAEGLAEAHKLGIVHRDLKPGNVIIDKDGNAKIMDFGIARSLVRAGTTAEGAVMGTPDYMSPEQVEGKDADQRSDIYSLGIILYEMLTGRRPFGGDTPLSIAHKHKYEAPEDPRRLNAQLPDDLSRVILRCLEKDKEKRFKSAEELQSELTRVEEEIPTAERDIRRKKRTKSGKIAAEAGKINRAKIGLYPGAVVVLALMVYAGFHIFSGHSEVIDSIAVLPFENVNADPNTDYLCDGITETIINKLSQLSGFKTVICRNSVFTYKGKAVDPKKVGYDLGVKAILLTRLVRAGDRLTISPTLVRTRDNSQLWGERYDRKFEDILSIEEDIAASIVQALRLKLTKQDQQSIAERPINNATAYEFYLKAHFEIWRSKEDALDRIVHDLQNALDITGANPLLYSAMADAYRQYVNIGARQEDYISKAEDYAKKALAINPSLPKAHVVLGYICGYRNQQEGIQYFKKALAINPNETYALRGLIMIYSDVGKPSAALPLMKKFKKIDPLNSDNYFLQGYSYLMEGQFGLALDPCRKYYQSDPENPLRASLYALILAYNKEFDKAFSVIEKCAKAEPNNTGSRLGLLLKYGLLKEREKALQILTPDFRKTSQRDYQWSYNVTDAFALLDEKKEALDWLENAVNRGFINYPFISKHDIFLDNIRGEERFQKLMERVKYEWEHFEE